MIERDHDHNEWEAELFDSDDGRGLDETFAKEDRRLHRRRRFKDEQPETYKPPEDAEAAVEARAEALAESRARQTLSGPLKYGKNAAQLFDAPNPSPTITARGRSTSTVRMPRERFPWLVTRALAGDEVARDFLIELTARLGYAHLATYDEETRHSAILEVTDKMFGYGKHGVLGLGVYFDVQRAKALDSWLIKCLKNAARDVKRKKHIITVPYSVNAEDGDDGEQERSPALEAQRLGNEEDGTPIIPGANSADPLRALGAQQLCEAAMSAKLTPREREAFDLHIEGRTDGEIAVALVIKPSRGRALIAAARAKILAAIDAQQ